MRCRRKELESDPDALQKVSRADSQNAAEDFRGRETASN